MSACSNPECERMVFSACEPYNMTQDNFCSQYCCRYVSDGYQPVLVSNSKHHKNLFKLPDIESQCDACGKTIHLEYSHKRANASFCNRNCHNVARKSLRGRKGMLRYQILRVLRDNPKEWWSASDLSKLLDDRNSLWTITQKSVSSNLGMYRHLVETRQSGSRKVNEYRFNPMYADYPLVLAMQKKC